MKKVIASDGQIRYYRKFVYCYKSVIMKIESFFKRPGFQEKCESWRKREPLQNEYGDIYDGKVWKEFLTRTDTDFLKEKSSLGLMLNVDWFSPFKHRRDYSVGALYISIMNLPREERFLKENILLVGIISAMQKEPDTLNPFLRPLVRELQLLWTGVPIDTHNGIVDKIKAALLCCAADIAEARKLCGFMGHSANRGCSHCYSFFEGGFGEKKDYSNLNRYSWPKRSNEQHGVMQNLFQNVRQLQQKRGLRVS